MRSFQAHRSDRHKGGLSQCRRCRNRANRQNRPKNVASLGVERRLPIEEARRIRKERKSRTLTQAESEAAICDGIIRFQEEYIGWKSEQIHAHFIKDLLVVRIPGVLTLAERQLGKSLSPEKGGISSSKYGSNCWSWHARCWNRWSTRSPA